MGAIEKMENAFNTVPTGITKYLVADSGYASLDVYNHLLTKEVNFAICLGEKVWGSLFKNYGRQKTRLKFFESDKCELGSILYPLKGLAKKRSHLRVVFIKFYNLEKWMLHKYSQKKNSHDSGRACKTCTLFRNTITGLSI